MTRFPGLVFTVTTHLIAVALAMQSGTWCFHCNDVQEEACRKGKCQDAPPEQTEVDLEGLYQGTTADFAGGDY